MGQRVDVGAIDGLFVEEMLDHLVEHVPMLGEDPDGPLFGRAQHLGHLGIDRRLGRLGEGPAGERSPVAEEGGTPTWVAHRTQ